MTTRPNLESDSYRRARELNDLSIPKDKDPVKDLQNWKRKNKGKDPITGMPLAKKKATKTNSVNA